MLAGGQGTWMRSDSTHKVCFEVGGIAVILRVLHTYDQCGMDHHIIVVGELGERAVSTVGDHFPNVSFAYQPLPLETGNAAKYGARVLQAAAYEGLVFVVVGDRLLAPRTVSKLIDTFRKTRSDVVLLLGSKEDNSSPGRVIYQDSGQLAGIVEASEIALSELIASL